MISSRPDRECSFLRLVEDEDQLLEREDDQMRSDRVWEYAPAPRPRLVSHLGRSWPGPGAPTDPIPDLAA